MFLEMNKQLIIWPHAGHLHILLQLIQLLMVTTISSHYAQRL